MGCKASRGYLVSHGASQCVRSSPGNLCALANMNSVAHVHWAAAGRCLLSILACGLAAPQIASKNAGSATWSAGGLVNIQSSSAPLVHRAAVGRLRRCLP